MNQQEIWDAEAREKYERMKAMRERDDNPHEHRSGATWEEVATELNFISSHSARAWYVRYEKKHLGMHVTPAQRMQAWLDHVKFGDWRFVVRMDGDRAYLQVQADEPCADTGEMHTWHSRKWPLSARMTRSEVVQTAFLAVMTAVEHETREQFKYLDHAIFSPHYDVEALVALKLSGEAEDVRA